jgi:hypoxanthine phosphoribosyltransferase
MNSQDGWGHRLQHVLWVFGVNLGGWVCGLFVFIEMLNRLWGILRRGMCGCLVYEVPTWSQIYDYLLALAQKIRFGACKPDVVVAVSRGGLVPARILVDLLEARHLATIQIEFYVGLGETREQPTLKQELALPVDGKKVLLVDDIADSGRSLQYAVNYLRGQGACEVKTATVYYKSCSVVEPDFYEKQTDCWVVFPWEAKETLRKIVCRQAGRRQQSQEVAKLVRSGLPGHLAVRLLKEIEEHT